MTANINRQLIPQQLNKNNFDCLRFFLAAMVIYSHCFVIYHGAIIDTEPVSIFTRNQIDLGGIAVSFFFVISGFLIVRSFEYSSSVKEYFVKRILRIVPGFFVAFLVSVFILGALGTITSEHKFGQWKYYLHNLNYKRLAVQLFTLEEPKGARTFATIPLPNMINEALWTIQYEFICYMVVPFLGVVAVVKRRWLSVIFFMIAYSILILQSLKYISIPDHETWLFLKFPSELPRFFTFFFAGSCFYFYRDNILRSRFLVLLSIAALLFFSWWAKGLHIVLPLAGTYLLFYFAYHPHIQFHNFAHRGDFSYGLYLYGWPIQQLIMYFLADHLGAHRLFFIAFPITFCAAFLSWNLVEKPFLKMKKHIRDLRFVKSKRAVIV
ncbi:MAG: acyltransferase [Ginsengibacter sp.]